MNTNKNDNRKSGLDPVFAVYGVGLAWAACGLVLPLHRLSGLLAAAILSAATYLFVKIFLCAKDEPVVRFEKTGVAEADAVIKSGTDFISALERSGRTIEGEKLAEQIGRLIKTSADIFAFVAKNPESARQLNTFIEYYFPTTLKLLESYAEFTGKGGGSVKDAVEKIEGVTESICVAFEKQLDNLYEHKSLDVRTDIEVLKTILERENLS